MIGRCGSTSQSRWEQISNEDEMTKPVLIFAGSFNPPTTAHRLILTELQAELPDVPIVVLPAPRTPHKDPKTLAPFADRMAMCGLLIDGMKDARVSDFATTVDSDQTIDIIEAWRAAHKDDHIIWVMGADSFVSLPVWHRWRDVIGSTALYVLARPGLAQDIDDSEPAREFAQLRTREAALLVSGDNWLVDPHFDQPASATAARAGDESLLLPAVRDYITQHELYKAKK